MSGAVEPIYKGTESRPLHEAEIQVEELRQMQEQNGFGGQRHRRSTVPVGVEQIDCADETRKGGHQ